VGAMRVLLGSSAVSVVITRVRALAIYTYRYYLSEYAIFATLYLFRARDLSFSFFLFLLLAILPNHAK